MLAHPPIHMYLVVCACGMHARAHALLGARAVCMHDRVVTMNIFFKGKSFAQVARDDKLRKFVLDLAEPRAMILYY